jgi:hypothetical protein
VDLPLRRGPVVVKRRSKLVGFLVAHGRRLPCSSRPTIRAARIAGQELGHKGGAKNTLKDNKLTAVLRNGAEHGLEA